VLGGTTAGDKALLSVNGPIDTPLTLFNFEKCFDFVVELGVFGDVRRTVKGIRFLSVEHRFRLETSRRHLINLDPPSHRHEMSLMAIWDL